MSRILAIDYGIKRTGIAITDEMQMIAFGLTTIPSDTAIAFLKDYFSKEKVERVIVGEPKQMDGTHTGKQRYYLRLRLVQICEKRIRQVVLRRNLGNTPLVFHNLLIAPSILFHHRVGLS